MAIIRTNAFALLCLLLAIVDTAKSFVDIVPMMVLPTKPFHHQTNYHNYKHSRSNTLLYSQQQTSRRRHQAWREVADPTKHKDFMRSRYPGGDFVSSSRDNLLTHYVYFVRLNSAQLLVFNGMAQVYACRNYFEKKIHPSTRRVQWRSEYRCHGAGPWFCRLPKGITEQKRLRILKLLDGLIEQYGETDYDFVHETRSASAQGFNDRTDDIKVWKQKRSQYRNMLKELLLSIPMEEKTNDKIPILAESVWAAIGNEACLNVKKPSAVAVTLQSRLRTAEKALKKMPTTFDKEDSPQRLSTFRRKRLARKQARNLQVLDEIGCPVKLCMDVLEDTIDVMKDHLVDCSASSSSDFEMVLNDLVQHHKQAEIAARSIFNYRRAHENMTR